MAPDDRNANRSGPPEGKRADRTKVLVVAPTWLGDAVMSLPLVGFLSAAPGVRLTVAARGAVGRVFWGMDGLYDLFSVPDAGRLRRIGALGAMVRATRAGGALVLPPSFSSALGCFLGGAGTRVGFRSDARRILLSASLDPRRLAGEHLSENYLRLGRLLLERLGIPVDRAFEAPRPRVFENEAAAVRERLRSAGARSGPYAVVVPGASYGTAKAWPADRYRELVRLLAKECFVVLGGTAAERELCAFVANGEPGTANLAGETTLGRFMALLAGALVVVANDSGAPHAAAALGVPVVVIFGSTSPRWTSPRGPAVRVLYEPAGCSPCFRESCPTRLECFQAIAVESVFQAAISVVSTARGRDDRALELPAEGALGRGKNGVERKRSS